jgi:hypothetical protein
LVARFEAMLALTTALSASGLLSLMAALCLRRWNKLRKQVRKREALETFDHADRESFDWDATHHDPN